MQKALIDSVVNHFDTAGAGVKDAGDLVLGEVRDCENARRTFQYPARQMKMQRPAKAGTSSGASHVIEDVVDRYYVGTAQVARHPEQRSEERRVGKECRSR